MKHPYRVTVDLEVQDMKTFAMAAGFAAQQLQEQINKICSGEMLTTDTAVRGEFDDPQVVGDYKLVISVEIPAPGGGAANEG